jgi:hypothetical protein
MPLFFKSIKVPSGKNYYWMPIAAENKGGRSCGYRYYIHTSGAVAVRYANGKERKLTPYLRRSARGNQKRGSKKKEILTVKIFGKENAIKHLVAAALTKKYTKGSNVVCKDGNEANCDYKNLVLIGKRTLGRETGFLSKSKKVLVTFPDDSRQIFRSVRECAKALFCSYQTVSDYINGKSKKSVLSDYSIAYTDYAENELPLLGALSAAWSKRLKRS